MSSIRKVSFWWAMAVLSLSFAGCGNKFFDPSQVGRFRPTPAVNVILDSLGVAEETPVAWENADEPRPSDVVAIKGDYTLRPGDLVRVSIFELLQEGVPVINDYLVSETGKVSIPQVGVLQAAGLTETQLEEEIRQIVSPGILKAPSVTAILLNSQQRTFSVLGNGVLHPGRYVIPRYDFRLADALATAGGPEQFNVSHIYVSREEEAAREMLETEPVRPALPELELIEPQSREPAPQPTAPLPIPETAATVAPEREIPEPMEPAETFELEREMLEIIAPSAKQWPASRKVVPTRRPRSGNDDVAATVMPHGFRLLVPRKPQKQQLAVPPQQVVQSPFVAADDPNDRAQRSPRESEATGRVEWVFRDGTWVPIPVEPSEVPQEKPAPPPETGGEIEWVFRDGRWVPIEKGAPQPARPPLRLEAERPKRKPEEERLPGELEWEQAVQTRLLKIPADKLLAGDPRYNIVIKPGDTIHVPVDIIGEFCIMGNVNRTGFVNITGRPMTLKMAVAAAGGLGPLAWPKHCEVVRRIGKKKEEIVMVDLDKIAQGEQPDFFIKPNDLVNVGTHPTSRWRAVLRNAFRAAYGFGFVYDRNFADTHFGEGITF